ncbi:hypothetical protein VTN77DRAFT_1090 [Rasamsonia byssochlamydoides]|uniref:uncharacterized protein n=1 Tax=Rasamsonia byssochlamydoides TaxID=89139 RepID=UPI0037423449
MRNALTATIATCDESFIQYPVWDYGGPFENATARDLFCSSDCTDSLASYSSSVAAACANDPDPWDGIPASFWGDCLAAYQERICLRDLNSTDYCIDIMSNYTWPDEDVALPDILPDILCSSCFMRHLQAVQSTPYSNYDESWPENYAAAQAFCNVSYPTAVQPWPLNVTQTLPAGLVYATGNATTSNSVSSGALRVLNNLFPDCSNLSPGTSLCLPMTCQTYTVQPNDTCWSIAGNYSTSFISLISYNPTINSQCSNLATGEIICLSPPSGNYTPTTIPGVTPTQTSVYATSAVSAPGLVAQGTTTDCGVGIRCSYDITFAQLQAWNPSINLGCTNLQIGEAYCVNGANSTTVVTTATTASSVTSTSSISTPTATSISTNGLCGPGVPCVGSGFGNCCSSH